LSVDRKLEALERKKTAPNYILILKMQDLRLQTGFIWLRIGSSGGLL